jgi:corrinoid protein of di/trimethylamine methyltransferase
VYSNKHKKRGGFEMSELFAKMSEAVIAADAETVNKLVEEALENGIGAKEVLDNGLIPGMDIVGQRMKTGEMFIPEVLRSAKIMQAAMDLLRPHLSEKESMGLGTYVIGTVEGDLHDIGKNLVSMMLQGAGFTVVDLGTSVKPQDFVDAIKEHKAVIVGMSALLTTTMPKMDETVKALKEAGIREQVKIMAGGAPVTEKFVKEIGADAYGANAGSATEKAKELVK